MNIELTEHVLLRYIERFNPNLNSIKDRQLRLDHAKVAVKSIVENAHYVSDDERGILLHSQIHNCNLIVRRKKLITLYAPGPKIEDREKRHNTAKYKKASNE
jgi:hypothetical protein